MYLPNSPFAMNGSVDRGEIVLVPDTKAKTSEKKDAEQKPVVVVSNIKIGDTGYGIPLVPIKRLTKDTFQVSLQPGVFEVFRDNRPAGLL